MTQAYKTWTLGNGEIINKIRLYADWGKLLTQDGTEFFGCVDVDSTGGWHEVAAPEDSEY